MALHVEDVHRLVQGISDDIRPSVVGESWGAMLALAYASTYPDSIASLVLVGCGTFDTESRSTLDEMIYSNLPGQPDKAAEALPRVCRRRRTSSRVPPTHGEGVFL